MDPAVDRVVAELRAAQREIAAVTASADSADGLVTVTVNGGGELVGLDLNPRIYREHDTRALAAHILTAVTEASTIARRQVSSVVERLGREGG